MINRSLAFVLLLVGVGACGDDLGEKITGAETCRRQQEAATARGTALMCTAVTLTCSAAGQCSLADTNTCIARINAATTCDGILTAYRDCPTRCVQ